MNSEIHSYPQISNLDPAYVLGKISEFRTEDFPGGDLTSSITGTKDDGSADIVSKSNGIFCGADVTLFARSQEKLDAGLQEIPESSGWI